MLGFTPVGLPRLNVNVEAPAQLMWLNVGEIRRQIDKHAGEPRDVTRTLYAHFFSPKEEKGIYHRLAALRNSGIRGDKAGKSAYFERQEADRSSSLNLQPGLAVA